MPPRRALLFMPGDDRRKIEKGAALGVDAVIMDLEDGVALNAKDRARQHIAAALRDVVFGRTEKLVRINAVTRDAFPEADIAAIIDARPDGIVVPKVEAAWQIAQVSERLTDAERRNGWHEASITVLAIIETALGVVNVREIAEHAPRLSALIFGAEDLAGDMGLTRTAAGNEVAYARAAVVLHAKAFGMDAIDTPYIRLGDADGLAADAQAGLNAGYTGKLAIHPAQVDVIQRIFTPTPEQIAAAQRIIAAHDDAQARGIGAFALDGSMVDMPMVRAAQAVLKRVQP
jgi:citrate lyase beta subunit